ncbi:MAG: MFS transporter [Candidatus Krumholzibacteria bacterium]|nr:MFS transporter [Candidatus Krumholzibacteria bacterium]MDH4336898.1 MFS transporter [Candidatus Krumholzibacteria bacterium]MDH5269229.1 MFS transporter [Candidatus Krumholzibacteria bacterium]
MASRTHRIVSFLALRRSTVGVLAMVVLVGMGENMAERFLPIYILALGGGAMAIGLLQAMDNLLSALYSFPGGYLADRMGVKRALLVFNLVAIAGFALVILIPAWQAVLAGAVLFLSWSALSLPATISLLYKVLPQHKRTMGVSMLSLVRRVPKAIGPLLGGVFIALWGERDGVRLAFVAAMAMAVVALFLQQRLIADDSPGTAGALASPAERDPRKLYRLMNPAMKRLLVSDILIRFCEQIPYAFVVVWCMKTIAAPVTAVQFGLLTTIEMVVAMLIYIPVARLADRGAKKRYVLITFVFFTIFPLVLFYCHSFEWLVVAFVVRGLKEFGDPTRKSLIMDLCPEQNRAGMFGLYYLIRDVVVSVAALGGAFLWQISPELNLMTAFAFGIIGTTWFAAFGRDLREPSA